MQGVERPQLELTDLKQAFDQADETGDGVISLKEIVNILQQLGIEDITHDQIQKEFLKKSVDQGKEKQSQILFNGFLELMANLGLRKEEVKVQKAKPVCFLGNEQLYYIHRNNFSLQTIDQGKNEIIKFQDRFNNGYSLDPASNVAVMNEYPSKFKNAQFSQDLWHWISECKQEPKMLGGFIDKVIRDKQNKSPTHVYFGHNIFESDIRNQCLQNFGWTGSIQNTNNKYKKTSDLLDKHESNKSYLRAALISVFHFDFARAYHSLLYITDNIPESYKFLKSILLGLKNIQEYLSQDEEIYPYFYKQAGENSSKLDDEYVVKKPQKQSSNYPDPSDFDIFSDNPNFKEIKKIERSIRLLMFKNFFAFIKKLCKDAQFDSAYIRSICNFISQENSHKIMTEVKIPIIEKISYALRFADQDTLVNYLNQQIQNSEQEGLLDGLIYLGSNDQRVVKIIQTFVNATHDIQTAGLVSMNLKFLNYQNEEKLDFFFQNYKNLLNRLQFYEARHVLDRQLLQLEKENPSFKQTIEEEINRSTVHETCSKCAYILTHKYIMKQFSKGQVKQNFNHLNTSEQNRINSCPNCNNKLPKCNICLLPLQIPNPHLYFNQMKKQNKSDLYDISPNLDDAIVWCQNCNHGGHFNHLLEWFSLYTSCPISDCDCQCSIL